MSATPTPAKCLKGYGQSGRWGVNDGHGGGELLLALVVVGDDKIDAERRGVGRLVHARDAAVDRDDQRHAGLGKCADGVTAEAVPSSMRRGMCIVTSAPRERR